MRRPSPTLMIPRALYHELIARCRSAYPKEACGILAGFGGAEALAAPARVVTAVYPMTNVEESPIGYSMDPREQLALEKRLRQAGQHMLGIYHSHTASAAYPSSVDVRLAIAPELSYLVVSLQDQETPDVKSYRIEGTAVIPEHLALEVIPAGPTIAPRHGGRV